MVNNSCNPEDLWYNTGIKIYSEMAMPMQSPRLSVLNTIHQTGQITRRALCDETGLSPNRVGVIVSELITDQLVLEEMPLDGTPGRPAALLSINPDIGRVVGLDIGGKTSRAVVTDMSGSVVASAVTQTKAVPDQDTIVAGMVGLAGEVCSSAGIDLGRALALGVGVQGIVNTRTGIVVDWPNTPAWAEGWKGLDVPGVLAQRTGIVPVVVDDSVRAMGAVARRFGPARGVADFIYVFLGNGIGSAIYADGRLYSGSCGIAGEIGHVVVDENGPWCSCGSRGCLEVMASTSAVLRRVRERLAESSLMSALRDPYERDRLTLGALMEAAAAGDKLAFQILDETGAYVGKVLATALNLLGPEMVILGGPLAQGDSIILDAVQRQVRLHALQYVSSETRIVCDDQGELAGAHGAALRALDTLFASEGSLARLIE